MERVPVTSEAISSVGHDAEALILEIEFTSGGIYRYLEVPRQVFEQLMAAASPGTFFHDEIRDRYRYTHVGGSPLSLQVKGGRRPSTPRRRKPAGPAPRA